MVFYITFILALFHDRKCFNFINLFPCILWDLIIMGLVLSGEDLPKKLISRLGSRLVQPSKVTWGAHARSWRVSVFRDLANLRVDPQNALTVEIFSVTFIPFTQTIYTFITHKSQGVYSEENPRMVSTTPTLLERAIFP